MSTLNLVHRTSGLKILTLLTVIGLIGCSGASVSSSATATVAATETPSFTPTAAPTMEPGDTERTLSVGGQDRTYILHVPPGVEEGAPVPAVIMLHGLSLTISYIRSATGFDDISDHGGFIIAYPKGFGSSWNGGGCCGLAAQDSVDDVEFVRQIIADLKISFNLDSKRIYAAGFSNGAMMTYRLGCEMAETFAAIATVSGPMFYDECQPDNAVAFIHIHGLSDPVIPYAGGESVCDLCDGIPNLPPVEQGINKWVGWNGCSSSPTVNKKDAITHTVYPDCQSNTAVELYTIDGLEHAWPASSGSGANNFPATQTIWEFFIAHSKP
jgi:polyhydroxybutyrate depolymerase